MDTNQRPFISCKDTTHVYIYTLCGGGFCENICERKQLKTELTSEMITVYIYCTCQNIIV